MTTNKPIIINVGYNHIQFVSTLNIKTKCNYYIIEIVMKLC